jgi:hypothetical protein
VGSDKLLDLGTSTTVATSRPTTSAAPTAVQRSSATTPTTTVAVRRDRTVSDNDGFRLYLSVGPGGRVEFAADEVVPVSLRVENISTTRRDYDTNVKRNFEITRAGTRDIVWDNVKCKRGQSPRDTLITGTSPLPPGDSVSYLDAYPRDTSKVDTLPREDCRVGAGKYDVYGIFTWCAPGSAPTGTCYPDHLSQVRSLPVLITVL